MSTGEVKPRASSTTSKVAATGAGISIAAIIGLWSQVAPVIEQVNTVVPIIEQFDPEFASKINNRLRNVTDEVKKLDPTIIDIAKRLKVIEDKKKQDEQVTPQPKPEPTPVDPPAPTPTPSPDQQRIADMEAQIRKLLDELAKKHEPPAPIPVPTPSASLKVVDSTGKELTQPIEAGRQFKVASTTAGKWSVTSESPTTDYDVTEYPDHLVCVLRNGAKLSISHATESPLTLVAIIVRCQDAPRPPPVPVDPVNPDKKQTTQHKVGGIYICVNPGQTSVDESIVIKDLPYWDSLRATGITVSMHTPSAADEIGKWAVEQMRAKGIPPPAMVLVDRDRFLLDVVPVPKSVQAVDAVIAKAGGR